MRLKSILGALAAFAALTLASPKPAEASACLRCAQPAGFDQVRVVRHWSYYPRYAHVYATHRDTDPYAYRYEPRGYYPYYNSGYWVPRSVYRREAYPYRIPQYYQAWGHPKSGYKHYQWHKRHHGGHRHNHW